MAYNQEITEVLRQFPDVTFVIGIWGGVKVSRVEGGFKMEYKPGPDYDFTYWLGTDSGIYKAYEDKSNPPSEPDKFCIRTNLRDEEVEDFISQIPKEHYTNFMSREMMEHITSTLIREGFEHHEWVPE